MPAQLLQGLRILVVEDNLLMAEALCSIVEDYGGEYLAPASTLDSAVNLAATAALDGALLDINLHGVFSFPVASLLWSRKVPFLFVTGYDSQAAIPPTFRDVPCIAKPFDNEEVALAAARHFIASRGKHAEVSACPAAP